MWCPAVLTTHCVLASGSMALLIEPLMSVANPIVRGVESTRLRRLPVHTATSESCPLERSASCWTAARPRSLPGGRMLVTFVTARSR